MPKKPKGNIFKNLLQTIVAFFSTPLKDIGGIWGYINDPGLRKKVLGDIWRFFTELYQRIMRERVLREAGSLTYITIMGFVPFVVFILIIAPDLPFLNLKDRLFEYISNNLMPTSALAVNDLIEGMLERRSGFNVLNFIVMIVSSYALFRVIRNTFDRVLRIDFHYKQDLLSQIIKFLGTIILGVFVMIILFSSSSLPLISKLLDMPLLRWLTYIAPFIIQFILLLLLYMLMPSMKIRRSSLIRGAFWTALVWALVKSAFDTYIFRMTNYQAVYGALSALPIFLLWIYLNWVIILSGIAIVSIIEDSKEPSPNKRKPKQTLRLTLEMYSDSKLNKKLEKIIGPQVLRDIADTLETENEENEE
jgi:membrane protein